ncbi:glycine betaine ABC transporter substrate-binding protein [Chitinophaga nivalis]|uniref:Glycine betaine ABC transporter substrate-binding protein n=1 Tax=Chitinophaga nivalis TaxID=2991709 RepID=A0ABT3IHH7_9BACT|nr:glycine betaine ABC transporter substrate-binding protein [Chitinophaga nivalis]MCW3466891.1 glycine betaine ABC transporter substrate-binding protein [Chitinophaga nivalis]MCW3483418.1 glycine betaine ABC transporter substrate-binding protein [Chitinophaga nivalis]
MKKIFILALAALTVGFMACNPGAGKDEKKVTIAYVNWAEGVAMTQLAKNLLEKKGYQVALKNADVAPVFAAVANGDADIFMDAWMPVTHKTYMETFGQKVTVLNTNFDAARIGLVVPDYVAVKSIEDLNAAKKTFDGHIVGIDAGAGIMDKTEDAIKDYQLDYQLQSSSEAAMMATLKKSLDEKQPVVVTGWAPHWMFSRYKLRFLEDPKKVYGETEKLLTIANNEFSVKDTVAVNFFRKFKLNSEQLGSLMGALGDADGKEDAAINQWIGEHADLVKEWE